MRLSFDDPIRTDRLVLRRYEETDLDDLAATQSNPEVTRFLYWNVRDRAGTVESLTRKQGETTLAKAGDGLAIAVWWPEAGHVVGEVNLMYESETNASAELGFVFNPAFHGRGLASEASLAALGLAFEAGGFHRVFGRCDARNTASAKLMDRIGMHCEARLREDEWFKGEWTDTYVYGLLDREWPAVRDAAAERARGAAQARS